MFSECQPVEVDLIFRRVLSIPQHPDGPGHKGSTYCSALAKLDDLIQTTIPGIKDWKRLLPVWSSQQEKWWKSSIALLNPIGLAPNPSPRNDVKDKSLERDNKNKGPKKNFVKVSPTTECYKCQNYGHLAANCTSPVKIAFDNRVHVAKSELVQTNSLSKEKKILTLKKRSQVMILVSTALGQHHRLTYLSSGVYSHNQQKKMIKKRTAIFHTFNKVRDKTCKVITDSENCINTILSNVTAHPHPYKVHGSTPRP